MKLSKQDLDITFANLVRTGLARTRAELVKHVNKTNKLSGDDMVDGADGTGRDSDAALKRLSSKSILSFNKGTKQWDASESATPSTSEVPLANQDTGSEDEILAPTESSTEGNTMNTEATTTNIADIDAAINAAKKSSTKTESTEASKRTKLSAEERATRDAEQKVAREAKKVQREQLRAAKKAEREAAKQTPHMSKVDKAAEKLPVLDEQMQALFNELTVNAPRDSIAAFAAHLIHFNRVKATERALTQKVTMGDNVRITGGDARYVGQTGIVTKRQRIRCYVDIEGVKKPVYLFTSDVEVIPAQALDTASNG